MALRGQRFEEDLRLSDAEYDDDAAATAAATYGLAEVERALIVIDKAVKAAEDYVVGARGVTEAAVLTAKRAGRDVRWRLTVDSEKHVSLLSMSPIAAMARGEEIDSLHVE